MAPRLQVDLPRKIEEGETCLVSVTPNNLGPPLAHSASDLPFLRVEGRGSKVIVGDGRGGGGGRKKLFSMPLQHTVLSRVPPRTSTRTAVINIRVFFLHVVLCNAHNSEGESGLQRGRRLYRPETRERERERELSSPLVPSFISTTATQTDLLPRL